MDTVTDTVTVMAMDTDMEDTAITTARGLLSPSTMAMDMVMDTVTDMDMVAMDITTARGLLSPDTMAMDMVMDTVTDMVMATTDKMVFQLLKSSVLIFKS